MITGNLKNWVRFPRIQTPKYWHNCDIPARLFFKVLKDFDKKQLTISGRPTEKELEKAFDDIYDEFYKLKEDRKLLTILNLRKEIADRETDIEMARAALWMLWQIPMKREEQTEIISNLRPLGINWNLSKPIKDEISRHLQQTIPALETRLKIEKSNLENLISKQESHFEEIIEQYSDIKERNLDLDMSLRTYVFVEKSVKRIVAERKKRNNKNK